jgi:hypothetical protein
MIKIIPLVSPSIDYDVLFKTCKELLGRSVTSRLDTKGISTRSPLGYLRVLSEIAGVDFDDNPGSLLSQLYYSFLVIADSNTVLEMCVHSTLSIYSEPCNYSFRISILGGTLLQWRETIINSCSEVSTDLVRIVMEQCLNHFDKLGLGYLWSGYTKKRAPDKTLFLEEK